MYPQIIYWKWDDRHVQLKNYRDGIDDIIERSCFDHIYITTHWCHTGISSDEMREMIKESCNYIHQKGKKLIFEIDPRAEKSVFVQKYPDKKTAFIYTTEIQLDMEGKGESIFKIEQGSGGELFLGNRHAGETLLRVYRFDKIGQESYKVGSLSNITEYCSLERKSKENVCLYMNAGSEAVNKTAFAMVAVWYDFNDFFSEENIEFFEFLLQKYSDIDLDGIALDEMSFPWHPEFDFSPWNYMVWNNSSYYTYTMDKVYKEKYEDDLVEGYFCMRYFPEGNESARIKAVNQYHEFIRDKVIEIESFFYKRVKEIFGSKAFVGVHPTWYAIGEIDNTPEIWKNGIDWWGVPRDFGFTDEIMIYPVRLALTHKWESNIFYNMWYAEGTLKLETFYEETWKNARFGGRTITLGYECLNEDKTVIELNKTGMLEKVSDMEKRISLFNVFQSSPAASDILVIMGIHSSCNWLCNKNGRGGWDNYKGVFIEAYSLARDLWNSGYNCDLVGSYEVENGNVRVMDDGRVKYGSQLYNYVFFAFPQFGKMQAMEFMELLIERKGNLCVIGNWTESFSGEDVNARFSEAASKVEYYSIRPQIFDIVTNLEKKGISTNRVPHGCILQDGSVVITHPAPDKPSGNKLYIDFIHQGVSIQAKAEDIFALKLDKYKNVEKLYACKLEFLKINGVEITKNTIPSEILINNIA